MAPRMASWLTARPYAHRGLHDAALGVIENTPSAFQAAIEAGYGIECDVQLSADGEAMVHHDFILGRLTRGNSRLDERTTAYLKGIEYFATAERMPTLGELCDMVGDRVPLLVEIKSRFNGDTRLARRTGELLAACRGPVAAMSFDPAVVATLREISPGLPRGMVGMRRGGDSPAISVSRRSYLRNLVAACPQFLAYDVEALTTAPPRLARKLLRRPLLTWTVTTPAQREQAALHADQMIFEGFRP